MKQKNRTMKTGRIAFENHYRKYFSDEKQFRHFLERLKEKSFPILSFNEKNETELKKLWKGKNLPFRKLPWYKNAAIWPAEIPLGESLPGSENHLFYVQNASSLLPPLALAPLPGETILDACAAPGGKALLIAAQQKTGILFLNDLSLVRTNRLKTVFRNYSISGKLQTNFSHTNAATIFKKFPNYFDRILLDAPCSSEKHVYNSEKHLNDWAYGRIKRIKQTQYSLLNGLFLALKPNGRLVYSTCAVNPEENKEVIKKFLKKHQEESKIIHYPKHLPGYNPQTPFGFIDITKPENQNLDPMFVAIIQKKPN